eukprot:m51a1_g7878 hypothetical protein (181) ;mRNA; r:30477-37018
MHDENREKMVFSTRDGHLEYNVLSFGLKNAPATFQSLPDRESSRTPLHLAAGAGHAGVCAALLARGAAVGARDASGATALHYAAAQGHAGAAGALLAGAGDGARGLLLAGDAHGWTALHYAAAGGRAGAAGALLGAARAAGALGDALGRRDARGLVPEQVAAERERDELVEMLRAAGASL